jgi:dipeptidyl-peptidase-4
MKNYIDVYSNVNSLPSTYLCSETGEIIKTLIKANMSVFKDYNFIPTEFLTFKTHDGVELNAMMIKPANFDSTKKYPVLFHVYGGPGYQMVIDQWKSDLWGELLANKGYIYFSVDNREMGGRGKAFRNLVYKKFGYQEANDFIEAAKYLSTFTYVDASRIGIWGWSYGGYISALTLMKGADYFKLGISVAPVTDWKFYDNIYTERYMSLPSLNEEGYKMSSIINYADKLKGKFLLIHGTADDNVHFQNTVKLAEKLIELNKPFSTMFYPEKDHGIYGGLTRTHLYNMMTEFILNEL